MTVGTPPTANNEDRTMTTVFEVIHKIGSGEVDCLTLSRMNDLLGGPIPPEAADELLENGDADELLCRVVCECKDEAHFSEVFNAACDIDC
jgi:hypothetical protein